MKESPLLMSGDLVLATDADIKTKTRRVIKMPKHYDYRPKHEHCEFEEIRRYPDGIDRAIFSLCDMEAGIDEPRAFSRKCPYGQTGDRIWVKETWGYAGAVTDWRDAPENYTVESYFLHKALSPAVKDGYKWKSGRFMPKRAARLWLEVISVGVERLQSISEADVVAEGTYAHCPNMRGTPPLTLGHFGLLWDSINGKPRKNGVDISWKANPWVWVVEFRKVDA